jgi:hypothetical protein
MEVAPGPASWRPLHGNILRAGCQMRRGRRIDLLRVVGSGVAAFGYRGALDPWCDTGAASRSFSRLKCLCCENVRY